MNTEQIRERMGAEATTAEAKRLIEILNHFKVRAEDVGDADWFRLVAEACETA